MDGPMSRLAKVFFSSEKQRKKDSSSREENKSYIGQEVTLAGETYIISSGDTSHIDLAIESIEKKVNEYSAQ